MTWQDLGKDILELFAERTLLSPLEEGLGVDTRYTPYSEEDLYWHRLYNRQRRKTSEGKKRDKERAKARWQKTKDDPERRRRATERQRARRARLKAQQRVG